VWSLEHAPDSPLPEHSGDACDSYHRWREDLAAEWAHTRKNQLLDATADDAERVEYTRGALAGLGRAITDGVDVRGYLHRSLLDNYEWGSWAPTFGLVSVDRQTFERTVEPSARWYGALDRQGFPPA